MKKLFTLLLSGVLMISIFTTSFAADFGLTTAEEQGLLIETAPVPDAATEYAVEVFNHFDSYTLQVLNLKGYDINTLSLSGGYRVVDFATAQYVDNIYYFNVLSGQEFVASLIITYFNGEYGYQIQRASYCEGFNKMAGKSNKSYKVYSSPNAYYFVSGNEAVLAAKSDLAEADDITAETMSIALAPALYSLSETYTIDVALPIARHIIKLSEEDYTDPIGWTRLTPLVPNDEAKDGRGICWASCVASIIAYYNGITDVDAICRDYRDKMVEERFEYIGSSESDTKTATAFLRRDTAYYYNYYNGKPTFNDVVTNLANNKPIYTCWSSVDSNDKLHKHALVLCGCYWRDVFNPNAELESWTFMDPNIHDSWVLIKYDSPYVPEYSSAGLVYNFFDCSISEIS